MFSFSFAVSVNEQCRRIDVVVCVRKRSLDVVVECVCRARRGCRSVIDRAVQELGECLIVQGLCADVVVQ